MKKYLKADEIIQLIEMPVAEGVHVYSELGKKASIKELCLALKTCTLSLTRQTICDVLGFRCAKTAANLLTVYLDDPAIGTRCSAADALGKLADPKTGDALLRRFEIEKEKAVRDMLASALGGVGHRPAIPLLIKALKDPYPSVRHCAAWSLGAMKATEALEFLERAHSHEKDLWPKKTMHESIQLIRDAQSQNKFF